MNDNNNKPSGWGQNKNLPDSWGKGKASSPWENKQNRQPANKTTKEQSDYPAASDKNTVKTNEAEIAFPAQEKAVSDFNTGAAPLTEKEQVLTSVPTPEAASNSMSADLCQQDIAPVQADSPTASNKEAAEANEASNTVPAQEKPVSDLNAAPTEKEQVVTSVPAPETSISSNSSDIRQQAATVPEPAIPPLSPQRTVQQQPQFRQPAPPPPQAYVPPYQNNSIQYYPQPEKKSKTGIIIGVIIAILLAIITVLMFVFLRKSDDKSGLSSDVKNVSVTDIASSSSTAVTNEATTTNTTTITTTLTTTAFQIKEFPASNINNYPQYINALNDAVNSNKYDLKTAKYSLYDLNNDNSPELIVEASGIDIFAIHNGTAVNLTPFYGGNMNKGVFVYDTGYVSLTGISGNGQGGYVYYRYNGADELEVVDSFSFDLSKSNDTYEYNGRIINSDEFNAIKAKYGNSIAFNSIPLSNVIQKQVFTLEEYNDTSNLIAVGKVDIAVGMRKSPSASADMIVQIPQGVYVGIVSDNSGWYYAKYYADTNSPIYYGYIQNNSITITKIYDNNSGSLSNNKVFSCRKYGQIKAPDGGPIKGYSKSFIIDGGAMSCVRTDLMNNWHVTAVNYYIKNGITWYELYDTDDGDYYGWLDEEHITFY